MGPAPDLRSPAKANPSQFIVGEVLVATQPVCRLWPAKPNSLMPRAASRSQSMNLTPEKPWLGTMLRLLSNQLHQGSRTGYDTALRREAAVQGADGTDLCRLTDAVSRWCGEVAVVLAVSSTTRRPFLGDSELSGVVRGSV